MLFLPITCCHLRRSNHKNGLDTLQMWRMKQALILSLWREESSWMISRTTGGSTLSYQASTYARTPATFTTRGTVRLSSAQGNRDLKTSWADSTSYKQITTTMD